MTSNYHNPAARTWVREPASSSVDADVIKDGHVAATITPHDFHRKVLSGYTPTRLVPLPEIAKELGVSAVYLKDESSRLGLPAFKILGASWAICSVLAKRLNIDIEKIKSFDALKERLEGAGEGNLTLYTATDGEWCMHTTSEGLA